MVSDPPLPRPPRPDDSSAKGLSRFVPPLPLFALQPLLGHIVTTIAGRHPELFERLGDNCKKRFLIDPNNLPFFLLLLAAVGIIIAFPQIVTVLPNLMNR